MLRLEMEIPFDAQTKVAADRSDLRKALVPQLGPTEADIG